MSEFMGLTELESCLIGLDSSRVTERKRSADTLCQLLRDSNVVKGLNSPNPRCKWDSVLHRVQQYLTKEAGKMSDDESSSKTTFAKNRPKAQSAGTMLLEVVSKANSGEIRLIGSKLVDCVLRGLEMSNLRKYYGKQYMDLLVTYVLPIRKYWGEIQSNKWIDVFSLLKGFYANLPAGTTKATIIEGLYLIVKISHLHCALLYYLRGEFNFVGPICKTLTINMASNQQDASIHLAHSMCQQLAKDCRLACCKFGEDVLGSIQALYQSRYEDHGGTKSIMFDFMLLQMRLHHPKGSLEGSGSAYAYNWENWRKQIKSFYALICKEIDLKIRHKTIINETAQQKLWPNFLQLIVEVFRQIFHTNNETTVSADTIDTPPSPKRRKIDFGITSIIHVIQQETTWSWMNVLTELFKTYPEIVKPGDYVHLLQILTNIQVECKDPNTRYHLYSLLSAMSQNQHHIPEEFMDISMVDILWTKVWETAIRAVGLNQDDETIHELIQSLLIHKKSQPVPLFNIYVSGILNVNIHNVTTLKILCETTSFPEQIVSGNEVISTRKYLIKWLLETNDRNDISVFMSKIPAEILVGLSLKIWPYSTEPKQTKPRAYSDIEDCYVLTSFESGLINETIPLKSKPVTKYLIHSEGLSELTETLQNFCYQFSDSPIVTVKAISNHFIAVNLLSNLSSELRIFNVINTRENLNEFIDYERIFKAVQDKLETLSDNKKDLLIVLPKLEKLFSLKLHVDVAILIRDQVSVTLLQMLFDILNDTEANTNYSSDDESSNHSTLRSENSIFRPTTMNEKLNVLSMSILTKFCCFPDIELFSQTQQYALETLTDNTDFNPFNSPEIQMTVHIINALNSCRPGIPLADFALQFTLDAISKLLVAWQSDRETVVLLLNLLKGALIHVNNIPSIQFKNSFLDILEPLFEKREEYGVEMTVTLLDCFGHLAKLDPLAKWAETRTTDITISMTECLKSSFHEIRLAAIKHIIPMYDIQTDDPKKTLSKQKSLFKDTCIKLMESFTVCDNISEEQRVDEVVNRTASALHCDAAIIVVSPMWRKRVFFAMIQLVTERKLNESLVQKVITLIGEGLKLKCTRIFLDMNMSYVISHWTSLGYKLKDLPFSLFQCETSSQFFNRYLEIVIPIMLQQEDIDLLKQVSNAADRMVVEVIEETFPMIMAQYLPYFTYQENNYSIPLTITEIDQGNRLCKKLYEYISPPTLNELLLEKLDDVFIKLIQKFFDPDHFQKQFGFTVTLPDPDPPFFNHMVFSSVLKHLERQLPKPQSLISYFIEKDHEKLVHTLLELTSDLQRITTSEDQLKSFHRYTVFIDYIIPELQTQNEMRVYLIRCISHTLMYILKSNAHSKSGIAIAACTYFKKFVTDCLENCKSIFERFIPLFISTLVPIAKFELALSNESIDLLNFLIVEKCDSFLKTIEQLDPFPIDEKFEAIQRKYEKIKYGNDTFSLKQEITHFLNAGKLMNKSCRLEGLTHLKTQLSNKKTELIDLYSELHNLRGFSEDCQNSILHQLICMLVKLTTSQNPTISLEAARCLGELGPADLTTMVLKPEKPFIQTVKDPFLLIVGQTITLLSKYLVDRDNTIQLKASNALRTILTTKEGKSVVKANYHEDFGCGRLDLDYITPFLNLKVKTDVKLTIDIQLFQTLIDSSELWCPTTPSTHSEWIIELVCSILNVFPSNSFLVAFRPICKAKTEFAEHLFPLLIYLFYYNNHVIGTMIISKQFKNFFANHWASNLKNCLSQVSTSEIITQNRASVQSMLNAIHFVRLQQSNTTDRKITEMDLNYLHVAQGAQFCSAHFTSILYAELWCYNKIQDKMISSQSGLSSLDLICDTEEQNTTRALQNILRKSYKKIGDMDAMYGCGISYLLDTKSRIEHYKHLGRWDKVILHYDFELSLDIQDSSHLLPTALKNSGLHYLASNIKNENLDTMYESAWRLGNWDIPQPSEDSNINNEYEKYHYFALKSFHETDTNSMNQAIANARNLIIRSLSHASLESSKNLYRPLTQLQSLQEIENFVEAQGDFGLMDLLEKLKMCDEINRNEFVYVEPIQAQRIAVLKDILFKTDDDNLRIFLANIYLQLADEARCEGFHHIAQRSLSNLSYIKKLTPELQGRMMFQQAQLSWVDDKKTGRSLLHYLLENNQSPLLQAAALNLYGSWMVETRSINPQTIIEKYFTKALDILNENEQTKDADKNRCETLDALARFADAQYKQVTAYMESAVYQNKVQTIERFRTMATQIVKTGERTQDHKRAIALYERQSAIDEAEVNSAKKEKDMYLKLAVRNYLLLLEECDTYNLKMFRILSLCLSNKNNHELIEILKCSLSKISSYKFIPLLPQIVPHISYGQQDLFDQQINQILEKCMLEHPHHTLPIIMALADSYKDREFEDSTNNCDSSEYRVVNARQLIAKYKKNKTIGPIIRNMEIISTALVSLAYIKPDNCLQNKKGQFVIPKTHKIKLVKNVHNVLVPTMSLEVRKNCNYDNIIGIQEFHTNFSLVGGVNAPKKIICVGTDGIPRTQLVKGKDDLRQDAVMQQVFTIMNTLLAKNKQTSKLLIRTYKVVPLSQRSGIIEWCENTEPLGDYLNNAHKKYHPSDWTPNLCRKHLKNVGNAKSNDIKHKAYQEICANLRPVFHKFFITNYPQPTVWFERRRAYMHSVATSSMVGYILGLGDRHVQNILIDKGTAEVVHIDFGIAFEQGRVLPTPETVPFRLTRDIEAGMGICGIEGVFRRSCEKTMLVLRQNEETVLTILEVLLYDPLYAWTITAAEAYSRQKDEDSDSSLKFSEGESSNTNITAERALSRLKQKLQGTENGGVCSIEGQVEQLLQQARDPVNLSRLFNEKKSSVAEGLKNLSLKDIAYMINSYVSGVVQSVKEL